MGWDQLRSIAQENREAARREKEPPTVCPICGDILDVRGDGVKNCVFGHYRWPASGRSPGSS